MVFEGPVADQPFEFLDSLLADRGESREQREIEGEDFSVRVEDHQASGDELFEDLHCSLPFRPAIPRAVEACL